MSSYTILIKTNQLGHGKVLVLNWRCGHRFSSWYNRRSRRGSYNNWRRSHLLLLLLVRRSCHRIMRHLRSLSRNRSSNHFWSRLWLGLGCHSNGHMLLMRLMMVLHIRIHPWHITIADHLRGVHCSSWRHHWQMFYHWSTALSLW